MKKNQKIKKWSQFQNSEVAIGGSSFHETHTMTHSRGQTGSLQIPRLLIVEVGLGAGWGVDLRLAGDQVSPLTEHTQGFVLLSSEGQKPELIPHRGEPQTRRLDRLDRCDWSAKHVTDSFLQASDVSIHHYLIYASANNCACLNQYLVDID